MPRLWAIHFWILSLLLCPAITITVVHAVSVTLHNEYDPEYIVSMTCADLRPGHCCTAPPVFFTSYSAHVVTFRGLNIWNVAAIWRLGASQSRLDRPALKHGCTGEVFRSKVGEAGMWHWDMWEEEREEPLLRPDAVIPATGASYIEIPRRFPADSKTSNWLAAEGVLGLVAGDMRWFASSAASKVFGPAMGVNSKSRLRRDIRSAEQGTVYARFPYGLSYPTVIGVNGTTYHLQGDGGMVYQDPAGHSLDFSRVAEIIERRSK